MSLAVEVRGQGPALVVLHGWAMHAGILAPLADRLADAFELHLVDLPGHGRNRDAGGPLSLDNAARAVADAVPARALWLGWSLGGLVALQVAAAAPARVRGLAMVAANPCFVRRPDWPQGMEAGVFRGFAEDLRRDYRATIDRFLLLEAQGSDHVREEIRLLRAEVFARGEPHPDVLCEGLAVLEDSDLRAALPGLAMPSAWIAGRRDRLVSPGAMEDAANLCGGSFHLVASGGHAPFLTHADDVAGAVRALAAEARP